MAYKALNNIRNTSANHIMIDYRNAAAMNNFVHKPAETDGVNAFKIAKRLRKKANNPLQINKLSFLLNKHLGSSLLPLVKLSSITDFPKLKKKEIIEKILLGSYQFRMAKSYVQDLKKDGTAYSISEKFLQIHSQDIKKDKETKIIAAKLSSRHRRGQEKINNIKTFRVMYKIFIEYIPNRNSYKSIKSKIFM